MRLKMTVGLVCCTLSSVSFAQTPTLNGNNAWTGKNTFPSINNVLYVDGVKYSAISAAINDCPVAPSGCRIYVPAGNYTSSAITLGVSPCQSNFAQILELDPSAHVTLSGKLTLLCGGYIYGQSRDGSTFTSGAGFPSGTPMIEMGDNVNTLDARVEGVTINCGSVSGSIGVRARGINENSTIGRNYIVNCPGGGIVIDGSAVNTANYQILDNQISIGTASADFVSVTNAGTGFFLRNSLVSSFQQTNAGIHFSGNSEQEVSSVYQLHCEKLGDCIEIDGRTGISLVSIDTSATTLNTLHILSTATGTVNASLLANNTGGACPSTSCVVKNDSTGTQLAASNPPAPYGQISSYVWQNGQTETWLDSNGFHFNALRSIPATFNSAVIVNGTLTKPAGSFRIDHPLDPANKYLSHSFVESPDMKDIYDGTVILNASGEAEIHLPVWFEALNRDFRYQLSCIGSAAPVYIQKEIENNSFRIAGGRPGLKVSWQVTGIRHDAYAEAHRIRVEEDKSVADRGGYSQP